MLGAVTALAVVTPAQAVDPTRQYKSDAHNACMMPWAAQVGSRIVTSDCSVEFDVWRVRPRGTSPSGKKLVQLANTAFGNCIDTVGRGSEGVMLFGSCNDGPNQMWEVHTGGGDTVLKSWGAWTGQGRHLCLHANGAEADVTVTTCNVNNRDQQWKR